MEVLFTVLHILACVALISLVLIQDSKGGAALGIGGGGANSLLGATGAQTLAAKLTRFVAILFAITCLYLTYNISHKNASVIDGHAVPATIPPTSPAPPAAPGGAPGTPESSAPTAPTEQAPTAAPTEQKK